MNTGSEQWQNLIIQAAQELNITIAPNQTAAFAAHATELLTWNRKINLTRITDPTDMAIKHYVDSVAALPHIPKAAHILDIGTGAGFPGIPIKILRPDQPVTLIDAVAKKVSFLKHIIRTLNLKNTTAHHIRAEALPREKTSFGVIISRALTDLAAFIRLALPLLAPGGTIIALRGKTTSTDLETAETIFKGPISIDSISYKLPILNDHRTMVVIRS